MRIGSEDRKSVKRRPGGSPVSLLLPERPEGYRIKVGIFNRWNAGKPVTGDRIEEFFRNLKSEKFRQAESDEPYSNASINLFIAAVKDAVELTFPEFQTLNGKNILDRFFRKKLKRLSVDNTLDESKIFSLDELNLLSQHSDQKTWLFIKFLYQTGLRISEALDLRMKDISVLDREATVKIRRGKRESERKIEHVPVSLIRLIQSEFRSKEYLFQNHHHTSKTGKYSRQRWFQKLSELAWNVLGRKLSPHLLRHSHATALSENGVSYGAIQKRLGHKRASTTLEIYDRSRVRKDQLDEIMKGLD